MAQDQGTFALRELKAFGIRAKFSMILALGHSRSCFLTTRITKGTKVSDIKTLKLRALLAFRGESCLSVPAHSSLPLRRASYRTNFCRGNATSIAGLNGFAASAHSLRCGQRVRSFLVSPDRVAGKDWHAEVQVQTGTG